MPTFKLNGAAVELVPQDRSAFMWLASQVYRRIHEGPPIPAILTMFAHEGVTTQALAPTDARIQAILWTMWQMGIASAHVEGEGDARQIKWEKGEQENIDSKPVIEHFNEEATTDGRALACAILVANGRHVRVNGMEFAVKVNNMDLIKAQAAEVEKRRKDPAHDPAMSAATYIAELLSGGADQNDLRLRAALEVAADLGIRAIAIDPAQRTLRIEGFNEQAALATAFLQGAPVEQFKAALTRVQTLNRMATDQAKIVAKQGQPAGKQRAASPPPPAVASAQVPYKRRRRD